MKKTHPNLVWTTVEETDSDELLRQVADGELDYTMPIRWKSP
ncbi:hypothetical protein JCM19237_3810 [Photobacterium aphoticum]|uniref:Uncharacterized protein n=1 Tax=Photobacterium aphoticum TaxID=754436 RepID=A0A090QXY9_9GAMM|nr:hypothetical protein JCM19237_3810 [Photobacterium aphoticum]